MTTIFYLEITEKPLGTTLLPESLTVSEIQIDQPQFNRFLYQLIGAPWQWTDKLKLSDEDWNSYVCRPELRTWVAYKEGAIAGYFELETQGKAIELKYFGLEQGFIGQGYGKALLSYAIAQAWAIAGTERVWVHTCSLDHENALNNYQRCGFKLYKTEQE
ncbi:GNAT family N-acetyltransferase [Reinekea marinisedimentorum]|uniref:Acetyltransferase (GNAT) family protein n=1 Tax=Reinekea marinisedimentorum TaxID=230495 RepID=A0A4R3I9T0_9GAMM|nr:GNAT family N-acetyltransferase [Reinekea marinisedimentorum]TCS43030.1 acetyltransferase (GNAT) family protein [Reinekea marinisedimentorum]